MKKIFAIAWKDAIIRFASSSELLFFIILPIVFTFLLAGGTPQGNGDPRIRLLVVDEAQTAISQQIIGELENSTAVRPDVVTHDEAQYQFDERRASAVFIIPAGIDTESLQNGSAEVELLQQPNNLNATVGGEAGRAWRRLGLRLQRSPRAHEAGQRHEAAESHPDLAFRG